MIKKILFLLGSLIGFNTIRERLEEKNKILKYNNELLSAKIEITKKINSEEFYWNNKWSKTIVKYVARGYPQDVRNLLWNKSFIIEGVVKSLVNNKGDLEKVKSLLQWVTNNITYFSDMTLKGVGEYWQDPEETYYSKKADCEDGALLLRCMCRIAGIPDYKIKLVTGNIKNLSGSGIIGHAYLLYLHEGEWYTVDWTYLPNDSLKYLGLLKHSDRVEYLDIWWTCNEQYMFSTEKSIIIGDVINNGKKKNNG